MRHLFTLLMMFILIITSCKATFQEDHKFGQTATIIKKGKIESVIFSKDADCFFCNLGVSRFTPTIQEINEAEEILKKNIKEANVPMYNQGDGCPIIHKNLKNYRRQYFGFVDLEGNKVLYVNFSWAKYSISDKMKGYPSPNEDTSWKEVRLIVHDGCSYHWEIEINLTKQILKNLSVNGLA